MTAFRRVRFDAPGGEIAGIAFGPADTPPDIVFLHATGFNALTYRSLLAPLGERFSVWAVDLRGHGRTTLPAKTFAYGSWRRHRDDVIALLEKQTDAPVTLSGHSFGATVSLMAAVRRPDLVSAVALIDPVLLTRLRYAFMHAPLAPLFLRQRFRLSRQAARRRAHFPDKQSAVEAFSGRGVFKLFARETIEDYVEDGLVEDGAGAFKLACAPAYEAATFAAHRNNPWPLFNRIQFPLVGLRAGVRSTFSEEAANALAAVKGARIATIDGAGHMLPMERPDRVRAAIESAALLARQRRPARD